MQLILLLRNGKSDYPNEYRKTEPVIVTKMCMITKGNQVLVQERKKSWQGLPSQVDILKKVRISLTLLYVRFLKRLD